MSLTAGARLGPYEIVAPLGAGGMGEVYRARDARLGRDVAIKILPASFSDDADRLRRFERNARVVGGIVDGVQPATATTIAPTTPTILLSMSVLLVG